MDDVAGTLELLEQRLRALESDLAAEMDAPRATAVPPPAPEPAPEHDELVRFREQLRRTAAELVEGFDAALAQLQAAWRATAPGDATVFHDAVELRVSGVRELQTLCALERALARSPAVEALTLRTYGEGVAVLDVGLGGAVPLVAELRAALPAPFTVVDARAGRLAIALSA